MVRRCHRPLAWLLLASYALAACSFETRWQMYQDEKAAWAAGCTSTPRTRTDCTHVGMMRSAHDRWDALLGRVPASDAMWAEQEQLAAELEAEIRAGRATDRTADDLRPWQDRRREIDERYALDIAQQLADREREAEARRQQAIIALAALGLIAQAVAAAAPAPRGYMYQQPTAAPPSRVDPAARRNAEAQWAVRTGGATGGAKDQYIRDALKQRTTETCTYSLNTLGGMMVCVDSQGNVRAR
jgi:hypothetical protein